MTSMCNLKYDTNEHITKQKQTHSHREYTCDCQGRGGWGEGRTGLGVWDQQMQTIIYRMDKQQDPTVQHIFNILL